MKRRMFPLELVLGVLGGFFVAIALVKGFQLLKRIEVRHERQHQTQQELVEKECRAIGGFPIWSAGPAHIRRVERCER